MRLKRCRSMARLPRDEQGSLIVALIVIFVLASLGAALVTQVVAVDKNVVTTQHQDTAQAAADAGVSDALFRLDQIPDTSTPSSFCVAATANTNCPSPVASSVPGVSNLQYQATYSSSTNSYTIQAKGQVNGTWGAVQVTASRVAEYPYAIFGNTGLTFNGNANQNLGTYTESDYNGGNGNPNPEPGGAVAIGSNGPIECNGGGGLGSNVTEVYFSAGGGVSNGDCGYNTPNAIANSAQYVLPVPTAPTGTNLGCPDSGDLGSGYDAAYASLAPGTYLCTVPVTIDGTLSLGTGASGTDPVKLYIILPASTNSSSTTALTITAGSEVNASSSYTSSESLPVAAALQVYTNSIGAVGGSNGQGYTFGGILDAPNASLTENGCKSTYYGALLINTLTCNGGPHLAVYYDESLGELYSSWSVSGYTEIPAADVPNL